MYPTIKVVDLGLAKIEAATKNNTYCGTPGYLPPECAQNPQFPGLNWSMDIYAVGIMTYELYLNPRPELNVVLRDNVPLALK
jgi:serine/threonine protein kinase